MLIRTQLLRPEGLLFHGAEHRSVYRTYNQMFTLHGAVMIFLVLIPGIPAALGNFVLPLMLGAKDVAFPRLNLWSYYLYVIGMLLAPGLDRDRRRSTRAGPSTRPTAPRPAGRGHPRWCSGRFVLGFSSIFTGINFIVTIHKLRPPGMTWFRMPLFLWALVRHGHHPDRRHARAGHHAAAVDPRAAVPRWGSSIPYYGGDPILFQHFFWFYSHPAVYIMILPAMGVMSEVISTFCRREIFGYRFVAMSSIAIALIGFLVWGHHMFPNGQSGLLNTIFSALTMLVAIPSAIKVWNWLATMYKGSIDLQDAHVLRAGVLLPVRHRRADGAVPGHAGDELPRARHLLRRGPFPLRDDRRHDDHVPRRPALLVAEDHRPDVQRDAGPDRLPAAVRRLQPDVLPAVRHGHARHAAALCDVHRPSSSRTTCCRRSARSCRSRRCS